MFIAQIECDTVPDDMSGVLCTSKLSALPNIGDELWLENRSDNLRNLKVVNITIDLDCLHREYALAHIICVPLQTNTETRTKGLLAVIRELQQFYRKHGDVPVSILDNSPYEKWVKEIKFEKERSYYATDQARIVFYPSEQETA